MMSNPFLERSRQVMAMGNERLNDDVSLYDLSAQSQSIITYD